MAYYKPAFRRQSKNSAGKWYPSAVSLGRVTTDELCDEIAEISTVSHADVVAVLKALNRVVGRHLAMGQTVQLKGLCNARLTINASGNGVDTAEEVSVNQIKDYRVVFAAEQQKSGAGNAKTSSLNMGKVRWELAPDFFKEDDGSGASSGSGSGSGSGSNSGSGSGNGGGTTPNPGGDDTPTPTPDPTPGPDEG